MVKVIVPGGLNIDIVAYGADKIAGKGELVRAQGIHIGPGGKSRNIASMIGAFLGAGNVAMVGVTAKDAYGLWEIPYNALRDTGVLVDHIQIIDNDIPGYALIAADNVGNNQIYLVPGVNNTFTPEILDQSQELFKESQGGLVTVSLEMPVSTALRSIQLANENNMRVILDPGGMNGMNEGIEKLLRQSIFCLKPNEHEAEMLTGIAVTDFDSAKQAYEKLKVYPIEYVLITHGASGAYLFGEGIVEHIPITDKKISSDEKDATGCGDQTTAILTTMILEGKPIEEAVRIAILAGTLQFHTIGVQPITREQLELYI